MTKEQWQKDRKELNLPASAFFDFYRERGGKVENIQDFIALLYNKFLTDGVPHLTPNGKIVSGESAEKKTREYYDKRFNKN